MCVQYVQLIFVHFMPLYFTEEEKYMRCIGLSTGAMYKFISPCAKDATDFCRQQGCTAVEINCQHYKDLDHLSRRTDGADVRSSYEHLSLHAPTDLIYGADSEQTAHVLSMIAAVHALFRFTYVVFHPETIADFSAFRGVPYTIGIENADYRKKFGRRCEDFEKIFRQYETWGWVWDANHSFSHDPTMRAAQTMLQAFGDRMLGIHLSGFREYHELIYQTKQMDILQAIPHGNTPIIIESVMQSHVAVIYELAFVREYFS